MKQKSIQIAILLALTASLFFAGRALAHALLLRSVPAANAELSESPETIELWFSEPIEAGFSSVRILNTNGDAMPLGAQTVDVNNPTHLTTLVRPLPPGIYTVAYASLSRADGHAWNGSFPIIMLNPDGSRPAGNAAFTDTQDRSDLPLPLPTLARWLTLTAAILLMGIALFMSYVASAWMQNDDELKIRLTTLAQNLLVLTVTAIVLGSWLQLITQAIQLESISVLPRLLTSTNGGALNIARQTLSTSALLMIFRRNRIILTLAKIYLPIVAGLLLLASMQGQGVIGGITIVLLNVLLILILRTAKDRRWLLLSILTGAVLLTFSAGSHAGAATGSLWAITFDLIHLLASSAWMGGLMLLPLMLNQHRQTAAGADPSTLRVLFRRYGQMAKLSFFLLWGTGLLSSLIQIPTLESLINTDYGRVLLLKVLLMFVVWGISIYGSRLFRGKPAPEQMQKLLKQFTRLMSTAALIGLLLMVAVAVLVQTQPPPKELAPIDRSYHNYVKADDLNIHLQIDPAQIGLNQFYVQLWHEDATLIGNVQLVRLMFNQEDTNLGQSQIEMQVLGPDRYWIEGAFLNQPGRWKISVYVRRRGLDDTVADLGTITLPFVSDTQKNAAFQNPFVAIPIGWVLSGGLLLCGFEILRWRKTFQQVQPKYARLFVTFGVVVMILGVTVGILQVFH